MVVRDGFVVFGEFLILKKLDVRNMLFLIFMLSVFIYMGKLFDGFNL